MQQLWRRRPAPAPPPADPAELARLDAQIKRMKGKAKSLMQAGNKPEAMRMLKQSKLVEIKWAALEYGLEERWMADPCSVELLSNSVDALEAEKETLLAESAAALSQGQQAPAAATQRLTAVSERLTELQDQEQAGTLTTDAWYMRLTTAIARDEKLETALRHIKKTRDADAVAARLALA